MYGRWRDVDFGTSLQVIGDYAFSYGKYKYGIHIPSTISCISYNAFKGNVILNPDNISANIVSIDIKTERLSNVMNITKISDDYSAENVPGFTDGTVVSAIYESNNPYNSFAFAYDGKLNFCPSNISIDLLNKILVKADENSISACVPPYLTAIGPSAFYGCD